MVDIVAITSCPTGIAHTYMAAAALAKAASNAGISIKVETQGHIGAQTPLEPVDIESAKVVLIAADIEVDKSRFTGKTIFETSSREAIVHARDTIVQAMFLATRQILPASGPDQALASTHKPDYLPGILTSALALAVLATIAALLFQVFR